MSDELICPNCNQTIETGATYCGNCGFKLNAQQPASVSQVYTNGPATSNSASLSTPAAAGTNVPAYAVPHNHHKQHWAVMAIAFGILGIGASVLIPILGIAFGICGLVLITSSYSRAHGWLKPVSIIVSALAICVGIGFWVNAIAHNPALHPASSSAGTTNGVETISVNTPCYSLSFNIELNVNNDSGSCSMNAYNSTTFDDSSNVYKVVASQSTTLTSANIDNFSKQAIAEDFSKNLPTFAISSQSSDLFDGSPAYYVDGYDSSANSSVIEETILHIDSSSKDNFFDIIHAVSGQSVNLNSIEKNWQWND